jgi:hypothetical protein
VCEFANLLDEAPGQPQPISALHEAVLSPVLGTVWGIILIHFELFILHFIIFDSLIIFVVLMNVPFHPTLQKIMFARVFHPLGDLAAFIQPGPGQGYCGLLGHESINESVKLKPSGSFAPRRSYIHM